MRITPPTTPPAIAPAWLLDWEGLGVAVGGAVGGAPAEDVLVAGGVVTPEAPKIAPGPISGLSISNVGVRQ